MSRNPVGDTHEDIDGIFGVLRGFLKGKSWNTLLQFMDLIKQCFANATYPVFVNVFIDSIDYKKQFQNQDPPVLDNRLSHYSHHGENNFNPGMHSFR
jgi:hypothetical protein